MDSRNYEMVLERLTQLIATTARMDVQAINPDENLIELGADSIILTDVNGYIREEFNVEIPLTLFFEQLTSVADIADYLYPLLTPEYFSGQVAQHLEEAIVEKIEESAAYIVNEYNQSRSELGAIEPEAFTLLKETEAGIAQLFAQQLQIMNNQILLLSGNQIAATSSFTSSPTAPKLPEKQKDDTYSVQPAGIPVRDSGIAESTVQMPSKGSSMDVQPYIAHKRLEMTSKKVDEQQQNHILELMERYTAKTKRSKEFASRYRLSYADWRNISGFRPGIKEMVYQLVFSHSEGAHITDMDGNDYIDLTMDFGVSLFGHNAEFIKEAIQAEMEKGFPLSLITELSGEVAAYISEMTGVERVSFFNSGTEAVMVAMRLARAATGRKKIVIFSGAYHGTFDGVLGMHPMNREPEAVSPIAGGILQHYVDDLFILDYDDPAALEFISKHAEDIAAVMVEPVQSRRPDVQPREFLHQLRELTQQLDIKLIFDEMILGFRLGKGGAQAYFGVQADLVTYGKIVGGGMPIGIVAGKQDVMNCIDGGVWNYGDDSLPPYEDKRTFAGGTFCHHPLAMAAAKAVLMKIRDEADTIYPLINQRTRYLAEELNAFFTEHQVPAQIVYCGSLFRFVLKGNMEMFYYHLLDQGIYIWEGRNCFLSVSHTDDDMDRIIAAVKETCLAMKHIFFAKQDRPSEQDLKKKTLELTVEQQKMIASDLMHQGTSAFHQRILLQISGRLDITDLQKAAAKVASRHEALRYTFAEDMSGLVLNEKMKSAVSVIRTTPDTESELISDLTNKEFDYIQGPLYRVVWLEQDTVHNEAKLLLVFHHFVADGWSMSLFCEELIEIYNELRTDTQAKLGEVMGYGEYTLYKENVMRKIKLEDAAQFWKEYLYGSDQELALPRQQIMAPETASEGKRLTHITDEVWLRKVRKAAAVAKSSPFMLLLSSYQALLHQITGQTQFAIGIPMAGQALVAPKAVMGNCASILPIVATFNEGATLTTLADDNREIFRKVHSLHHLMPEDVGMEQDHTPRLNIMFNMDRMPQSHTFANTQVQVLPVEVDSSMYDLFLNIIEHEGKAILDIDYNQTLFTEGLVRRWLESYLELVQQWSDQPNHYLEDMHHFTSKDEQMTTILMNALDITKLENLLGFRKEDFGISNAPVHGLIMDKKGSPVLPESPGELYIGNNRIELYPTGWTARIRIHGELEILGPCSHCYIENGRFRSLWLTEQAILEHPSVQSVRVRLDSATEELEAVIESALPELSANALSEWCFQRMPTHWIPKQFYLQDETQEVTTLLHYQTERMTATERSVYDTICSLLGFEAFGLTDNIISLGMNSLKLLQLLSAIQHQHQGLRLSITMFMDALNVYEIAAVIDKASIIEGSLVPVMRRAAEGQCEYETSAVQKRMYVLNQLQPETLNYNMPSVVKIQGQFDPERFKLALEQCIERHENLRTCFKETDGEVVQQIIPSSELNIALDHLNLNENLNEDEIIALLKDEYILPFRMDQAPLMRVSILEYGPEKTMVFMDFHHIIFDGSSALVFAREIISLYHQIALTPLLYQYKDFVLWQKDWFASESMLSQERYWKERFEDLPTPSHIPFDHTRPVERTYEGRLLVQPIGAELKSQIVALCKSAGVTGYSFFLAAFNLLLSMYSMQKEVVLGTLVEGRNHAELQPLIGMFVNTLPLRHVIMQEQSFVDWLKNVQQEAIRSFAHSEVPFDRIVELSGAKRERGRNPMFDILFSYQDFGPIQFADGDLSFEYEELWTNDCKFDLEFEIVDKPDQYEIVVQYAAELYEERTMNSLIEHFMALLKSIVVNPDSQLSELSMLTESEKTQILTEFNRPSQSWNEKEHLVQLFEGWAKRTPDRTAVRYEEQVMTYGELNEQANQLAHYLVSLGLTQEEPVGIMLQRSPQMIRSIMGIWKAGAAYLPLDLEHPVSRRMHVLNEAGVKWLLTSSDCVSEEFLDNYGGTVLCLDTLGDALRIQSQVNPNRDITSDQLAYILFTSGSTGIPKGVMIEHGGMLNHIFAEQELLQLDEHLVFAQNANQCFDISVWQMTGPLALGGTTAIYSDACVLEPERFIDQMMKDGVTLLEVVPSYMAVMMDCAVRRHCDLRSIRHLIVTGETVSPHLLKTWFEQFPHIPVVNAYGPAEASDDIAQYMMLSYPEELTRVPIGRPLANMRIYVLDSEDRLCPVGLVGELCVAGISVGRGYVNDPVKTQKAFVRDPFANGTDTVKGHARMYRTGDLARWLPDGTLEYMGRSDEQVKIRGYRIELGEIESALRKQAGVFDAAVIARGEAEGEKYLCAYIVKEDHEHWDAGEARLQLTQNLPEYMVPAYFVLLNELPVTRNGKLDRQALPEPDRKSGLPVKVDPRNETEALLVQAFSTVLNLEDVGIHDHFFERGGHSLRAIRAINLIEGETGIRVPLRILFEHPTPAELGLWIGQSSPEKVKRIPLALPQEVYPMSSAQKRLYFIHEMDPSSTVYNMPGWVELPLGDVDMPRLSSVIHELMNRHESLRTSFHMEAGEPIQRIHEQVNLRIEHEKSLISGKTEWNELLSQFIRPFDVSQVPLLRMKVVRTGTNQPVLLFDMHHLISDGTTINIITREFSELYHGATLPPVTVQYKDYSEWLRMQDREAERSYWLNAYAGELPVLDLPLDYPRPQIQRFDGGAFVMELDNELRSQVQKLCHQTGATEYMVLMSGLMILLGQYSRQEDIIIGSPVSGRVHSDTESTVGLFVNTLALRGYPEVSKIYLDFLTEIQETSLKAYEYQTYPFEELVEQLQLERDLSRNPLFDVVMVMQNQEEERSQTSESIWSEHEAEVQTAKFDLTLNITPVAEGYHAQWEFARNLFKKATVQRLASHYKQILSELTENPQRSLGEFSMVTPQEREWLLDNVHVTPARYPEQETLKSLFEAQVRQTPDRIAAVDGKICWSYAELNRQANRIAHQLLKHKGQGETVVALLLERNVNMLAGILGVVKAGGVYLPMDPEAPVERIQYMLQDSQAQILLSGSVNEGEEDYSFDGVCLCIEDLLEGSNQTSTLAELNDTEDPEVMIHPTDALYIIYTSGTTGQPKGTLVEHRNVVRLLINDQMPYDFSENDVWSLFHAYNFDFSVWEMYGALLYGGKAVVVLKETARDSQAFLSLLRDEKVTVLNQVPSSFYELMHAERAGSWEEELYVRLIIFGGEALNTRKLKVWQERYPQIALVNMYGITETTVHVTYKRIESEDIERGISNIGKAIPTLKLYIMNGNRLCGVGVPGELCIAGAGVARGYVNRPELTESKFTENPFEPGERMYRSGDIARWLPDGNVEYLGRMDDQVKIRGYRIELQEIENVLMKQPGVQDAAVIVLKDAAGDSYLSGYVVGKPESEEEALDLASVKKGLAQAVPGYLVPASLITLDKLPVTSNGKLDRRSLPEPDFTGVQLYVAPRDEREIQLAEIFGQVLGIQQVGIDDNFFELGGDSIKAIRVISKIREAGYELSVKNLMLGHTIRWISPKMENADSIRIYTQEENQGEVLLTPIQKEFYQWNLEKPNHFNQTLLLKSALPLNEERLRQALKACVSHHDMLRAIYPDRNRQLIRSSAESQGFDFTVIAVEEEQDLEEVILETGNQIQASIDLSEGPLLKVILFHSGEGDFIWICLHHLVVDGVSWRILLEDLQTAYEQTEKGLNISLPAKTASYQEWALALREYALSEELERELPYWMTVLQQAGGHKVELLLTGVEGFETDTFELDNTLTSQLMYEANQAYHTEMNDLLLSAFVRSLAPWTGYEYMTIDLEGHGRESIHQPMDIDRTVGWFTSIYPVHLPYDADMEQQVCLIKEHLRKIPNHGMGYGVIRHFREQTLPEFHPEYCFNYLGQLEHEGDSDPLFEISELPTGDSTARENHHPHSLTVNASVVHGRLVLEITYDQRFYSAEQINAFKERFQTAAAEIAAFCTAVESGKHTASDYGDLDLEFDELDEIMKSYS